MSSSNEQNPEVGYFSVDKRKTRRAFALAPDQWKWLAIWLPIAAAIGIGSLWIDASLSVLALLPLAVSMAAWKTGRGIVYRNMQASFEEWRLHRRGNVVYDEKSKKAPLGLSVYSFEANVELEEIPTDIRDNLSEEQLQTIVDSRRSLGFNFGTLYSKRERTDTAYIAGAGLKGCNLNPAEVFDARRSLADGISTAASLFDKPPSLSLIYSRRPVNMIPQLLWDQQSIDPSVRNSENLVLADVGIDDNGRELLDTESFFNGTLEQRQATALRLARANSAVSDEEVTQLVAVSYKRPKYIGLKRGASLNGHLNPRQLRRMPIKRLADEFRSELSAAGVEGATVLSGEDVNKVIRTGLDVADIQDWQSRWLNYVQADEMIQSGASEDEIVQLFGEVPTEPNPWLNSGQKIVSGRTGRGNPYTKIGNTFHMVKQVSAYTKSRFMAESLLPLFEADDFQPAKYCGLTISLCGDIIDVASEQGWLTRKRTWSEGLRNARSHGDEIDTPQDEEQQSSLRNKQYSMYYGGVYFMLYNAYVVVSALTLEMLEEFDDAITAKGRSRGVQFRHIDNEVRHVRSLMTALYGANMVNR